MRRAASTIAVTDPLPLVPAMCTDRNARSGCPSASTMALMLSRPNLMPNCSSPNSQARESDNTTQLCPRCGLFVHALAPRPTRRCAGGWRRPAHESQRVGDGRLHLAPVDDQVQHAFLEQELRSLKPLGE